MFGNSLNDLNRRQLLVIVLIPLLLFGLLGLPLILQKFYDINAIHAAFAVVVVYAAINWWIGESISQT